MKILVLNCGSSSIKYQLFDMDKNEQALAKGLLERIGIPNSLLKHSSTGKDPIKETRDIPDHTVGIQWIIDTLLDPVKGCLKDKTEINAAGHRVAHGGEFFSESAFIDSKTKDAIEKLIELAPLHNPANLKGILAIEALLPGLPQVAVFDTSFHQSMPEHAFLYGLPYEMYKDKKIRRYGFHGTSHKFVAEKAATILGLDWTKLKIITCHLGNGSSIAAILNGKSIDSSMGYTPVEGLLMGTRVGDLDLGALLAIMDRENMSNAEANTLINKKSGLLGISGVSSDMRDIEIAAAEGNHQANMALEVFAYRVKKYIGSYMAALNGLDLLIFTGGIGENDGESRRRICSNMEGLGVEFDIEKNKGLRGTDAVISTSSSKVKVMTITTDEELVIARDTFRIVTK
ncbi:MAG: acetate kinase [Bacteroidetes bacterium GWF2_43_63]|nr:MAG: acetate kinase [Bacteroidetes bacterium GWE2_42_42]OFY56166.1 MAG: acetate kinase [Bacteroidetes bacterium GWF2_43_63]HBG69735.1 acetate kinase [Bacteroidales bacterium]HCB61111.1 acetate kinase [Bacteroidales bacterium]